MTSSTFFPVSMSLLLGGEVVKILWGWFVSACSSRGTVSGGMERTGAVGVIVKFWSFDFIIHSFIQNLCFFVGYNEAGVSSAFRFRVFFTLLIIIGWSIFSDL